MKKREPYVAHITGPGLTLDITLSNPSAVIGRFAESLVKAMRSGVYEAPTAASVADHYSNLGVRPDASEFEISEAYIKKIVGALPSDALDRAIAVALAERERRAATS